MNIKIEKRKKINEEEEVQDYLVFYDKHNMGLKVMYKT